LRSNFFLHLIHFGQRGIGELIHLIGTIGLGDKENKAKDILGGVYEYLPFTAISPAPSTNPNPAASPSK
jgi:hypothetical protein